MTNEQETKGKSNSWVKWVLLGCGVLVLGAVGFFACIFVVVKEATEEPRLAVETFLEETTAGDLEAAYDCFSAPLKEVQSFEEFSASVEATPLLFDVADTTFNQISMDMEGCEVGGTATLSSGTKVPCSFKVVDENGEWKLISYEIGE